MVIALLIIHGLVAVALLGAITHQVLAVWAPSGPRAPSFFGRFRAVSPTSFASAIVVLYAVSALLGGIVYFYFAISTKPALEQAGHLHILGLFEIKEHFTAIGFALLPAYWVCWRRPRPNDSTLTRAMLTTILAFIIWWSFLVGHVLNNMMGLGS
jgi:hypothetical protein